MTAPRIVLLSNDAASLTAMYTLLIHEGYRIFRCRPQDMTDALAIVKYAQSDLVILDLWLTKREDGWTLLTRMCADLRTMHIPTIIASGQRGILPGQEELLRSMQCHVLAEPFDAQELLRAIETVVGPTPIRWNRATAEQAVSPADPSEAEKPDNSPTVAMGEA